VENPITHDIKRYDFLGVPIDVLPEEQFEDFFAKLLESNASWKIALIRYRDFRRATWRRDFQNQLLSCSLVLPIDQSLEWGMKFAGLPAPHRYHPFDFIIKLLGYLEKKGKSVYLLGGNPNDVQQVFDKVRSGFPKLTVIGRHAGKYPKENEKLILSAIYKSNPTLLFIGSRVRGKMNFVFENTNSLNVPIIFWSDEAFNIMSGKKKITDRESFKRSFKNGTYYIGGALFNPLKWLRIPSYIIYFFMVIWQKYFLKNRN